MDYKDMKFKVWHGCDRGLCHKGCGRQNHQLNTFDWLADVPGNNQTTDLVEVQFKNTRKGYYHNVNNLDLKKGDIVAVEANPGHDIGVVTLTGRLVKLQIKKSSSVKSPDDIKRVYRLAKEVDMQKYHEAKAREHATMIESRQIAKGLGLKMKIGDVEYQGDGNKALLCKSDEEARLLGIEWAVRQVKDLYAHGFNNVHFYTVSAVSSVHEVMKRLVETGLLQQNSK